MVSKVSLPYATATAGDKALLELQKALGAFGCQSFGTTIDEEHQKVIVAFRWQRSKRLCRGRAND